MPDKKWLFETTLVGKFVTLLPLKNQHAGALVEAASDGQLWKLWYTSVPNEDSIHSYIKQALLEQQEGRSLPFVVVDNATQKIIGATRFCNADSVNQRIEIGYTWYAKSYQRTPVNSECKYLLLNHAFTRLSAIAVEFRTHWHNHASRHAIARLGAKQDGVIRQAQKLNDGSYRDTLVFSIINSEWLAVKSNLSFKLTEQI